MGKLATAPRERLRRIDVEAALAAPTNGSTRPHITLPPVGPSGAPCVGFALTVYAIGGAEPNAPGYGIQVYRLIPTLGWWASFAAFSPVNFAEQLLCYDVGGGTGLYFRFSNADDGGGEAADYGHVIIAVAALT